ncbi:MAG: hypothetical protein HY261_00115 [Chloroflexi bacterium]|nr:hypothetical protein [Chloroflexota bacterium]
MGCGVVVAPGRGVAVAADGVPDGRAVDVDPACPGVGDVAVAPDDGGPPADVAVGCCVPPPLQAANVSAAAVEMIAIVSL